MTAYTVTGMTCQHCVAAVTAEVAGLPGVDAVRVDLATGLLRIAGPGGSDRAAVAVAVDEAGYALAPAAG